MALSGLSIEHNFNFEYINYISLEYKNVKFTSKPCVMAKTP